MAGRDDTVHTAERLKELQALPLDRKIMITQTRIIEWYQHYNGNVCVSFSGGKDSTVLLHIARQIYPDIKAVFSNTGLEYPEIQQFVRTQDNVDIVTPDIRFVDVLTQYGYPLISKEVAEAIYYARRIRSQSVNVEREREHRSVSVMNSMDSENRGGYRETRRRRNDLHGRFQWENRGGTHNRKTVRDARNPWTGDYRPGTYRRWDLSGRQQTGVVIPTGTAGDGGVFSNVKTLLGEKSIFNKEKYLPLARDVPVKISHYCCNKMKKKPMHDYQKKHKVYPILAIMADESRIRKQGWIRTGCNAFDGSDPKSQPMSFWTEQDVLQYIIQNGLSIASVYGDIVTVDADGYEYPARELLMPCGKLKCTGCERTGCVYCGFGFHNEKGVTRFQRLKKTHPRQYEYCIGGGQWADNPDYDPTAPEYDGDWKNWNPKQIWIPSKSGLGLGKVFDMVNEIYGKGFYRYE